MLLANIEYKFAGCLKLQVSEEVKTMLVMQMKRKENQFDDRRHLLI